ncbi:hypothetical protein E4U91_37725 [Streptomyces lasalocidi]|uniref:Uncharacterized protein n=1 Tax=Streptomyces lasalocidi TaxID=324833 RepID=A0A4V6AUK9_STRLS|nr:hypothetical protein E4U91_37725 [Streptomyces lasalocidi]
MDLGRQAQRRPSWRRPAVPRRGAGPRRPPDRRDAGTPAGRRASAGGHANPGRTRPGSSRPCRTVPCGAFRPRIRTGARRGPSGPPRPRTASAAGPVRPGEPAHLWHRLAGPRR